MGEAGWYHKRSKKKSVSRIKRFTVLLMLVLSKCWGVDSQREEPCSARGVGGAAHQHHYVSISMGIYVYPVGCTVLLHQESTLSGKKNVCFTPPRKALLSPGKP